MATATKQSRAAKQLARRPAHMRSPESMEFVILEDNGGAFHWTIVASDGATLVRSGGFASYDDAEQAAERVRDAAASARFQRRGGTPGRSRSASRSCRRRRRCRALVG